MSTDVCLETMRLVEDALQFEKLQRNDSVERFVATECFTAFTLIVIHYVLIILLIIWSWRSLLSFLLYHVQLLHCLMMKRSKQVIIMHPTKRIGSWLLTDRVVAASCSEAHGHIGNIKLKKLTHLDRFFM